jgi:hypothetical protein
MHHGGRLLVQAHMPGTVDVCEGVGSRAHTVSVGGRGGGVVGPPPPGPLGLGLGRF